MNVGRRMGEQMNRKQAIRKMEKQENVEYAPKTTIPKEWGDDARTPIYHSFHFWASDTIGSRPASWGYSTHVLLWECFWSAPWVLVSVQKILKSTQLKSTHRHVKDTSEDAFRDTPTGGCYLKHVTEEKCQLLPEGGSILYLFSWHQPTGRSL